MHVVIVSDYHISSYMGGNERYADAVAAYAQQKGMKVTYLCNQSQRPHCSYQTTSLENLNPLNKIKTLNSIIKTADLIHASGSGLLTTQVGILARVAHKPTLFTFQGPLNPTNALKKFPAKLIEAFDIINYQHIITTSPKNNDYVTRKHLARTIQTILLAPPPTFQPTTLSHREAQTKLKLSSSNTYILTVAKLDKHHYYKGISVALHALSRLPNNYHLLIVGSGADKVKYQEAAKKLDIVKQVHFLGHVDDAKLSIYYRAADVFILPSISSSEGFGLVLLEAMLSQTPIITTNVVGISPEISKQQAGIVIPANNPHQLAQAIIETIAHPYTIPAGLTFAKECSVESMCHQTIDHYQMVFKMYA